MSKIDLSKKTATKIQTLEFGTAWKRGSKHRKILSATRRRLAETEERKQIVLQPETKNEQNKTVAGAAES